LKNGLGDGRVGQHRILQQQSLEKYPVGSKDGFGFPDL
jgi:hypothetical protein